MPAVACPRRWRSPSIAMLETVIELRRGVLGFRETRSRGAYCATCKIGVPVGTHPLHISRLRLLPVCARAPGDFCQPGCTPTFLGQVAIQLSPCQPEPR